MDPALPIVLALVLLFAADEEAHKLMIAYGLSTVLPSRKYCGVRLIKGWVGAAC